MESSFCASHLKQIFETDSGGWLESRIPWVAQGGSVPDHPVERQHILDHPLEGYPLLDHHASRFQILHGD